MELNISDILGILPHRFPFLFIDRVLEIDEKKITAIKNVSVNEPIFTGHFPKDPVFPGVLLIEACAQASGILLNYLSKEKKEEKLGLFGGVSNFRFKKIIRPGDTIIIESELITTKLSVYRFKVKANVNEELAGWGEIEIISVAKEEELFR